MKEFIRKEVKSKTKAELIEGIRDFWGTVDQAKRNKYIRHLRKVIHKVIELEKVQPQVIRSAIIYCV